VQSSVLRLTSGGTSSGAYTVSSGATLRFIGGTHTLSGTASISGAGTMDAASGTVTLAGNYNVTGATNITGATMTISGTITSISPLTASGGQINLNVAATTTIPSLTLSGATLGGTTPLIVNTFNWSAGTVNRSGSIDIPSGSTMNLTSSSARYLYQAAINNSGTINAPMSGYIYLYNGATLNNLASGVVDLQGDAAFYYGGGATSQFNNSGTLRKSAGTSSANFSWAITNNGTVDLQTGILAFASGFTQSASGLFKVSIGGITAGTLYARGAVSGTAVLGGALSIVLTGGFTPTIGDTFQIMTFGSRSGDFATKSGLTYAGGSMSYAANSGNITLTGATATADLGLSKTVSSGTVATGATYSYTLTAQNLGPSAATSVSVTDTLPSGVSLNSATGTGWTCTSNGSTPPTITCTMASLGISTANPITLSVTAPASPTSITNSASITSAIGDPTSSNDTASVGTTIVNPTPGVTVTSFADSGAGTLRQAIIDANTGVCTAPCTIAFNLSTVQPIAITSSLPQLTATMVIDGTTQPGYSGTPLIEISDGGCGCSEGLQVAGSGSTIRGISIHGFTSKGLWLSGTGHTIELSTFGTSTSPNGIGIYDGAGSNFVHDNTIDSNSGNGVAVSAGVTGTRILANAIHDNGGIGIDLGNDGATANDGGDSDTGANNLQNAPVISAAQASAGTLNATLSVDSSGVGTTGSLRIEIFESDTGGEGMTYLGGACFAGNALTNQVVTVPATGISSGDFIVATATSYSGVGCVTVNDGTSEFSGSFAVITCTAPDATITAPASVCAGTTGHTASVAFISGATYTWNITNGTIDTGAGTNSITFTPAASGTVDLQVTVNDSGCSSNGTASIPINTATPAAITPGGPTTFCTGGSVTLSANNGTSYLWSTGATTQSIVVTSTGSYSVTVTDGNGCNATSAATNVTVNPAPFVTITGPVAMCAAANVTLDAGAGFTTYLWSTGETTQQILVSPATTTTYTVTVTNASNCSANDDHTVTVDANPSPVITPSGPTTFCSGGSVTLASSAANSYQWYRDSTLLGTETNATILATISGSYTVTVTNVGGCSGTSAPTVVTVNNTTPPTITPVGSTTFCAGSSVTLNASAGSAYQWNLDGNPIGGATASSYAAAVSGNYTVTVTDVNGCVATSAAQNVLVYPAPAVNITGPVATCANTSVTLDAGPGFTTYSWSTGDSTRLISVSPLVTTGYNVTVTDANGCTANDSHTVTVTANPTATITAPANACAGAPGNNASVAAQAGATYNWSIGNGTINGGIGTNAITFTAGPSGTVTLDVTVAIAACSAAGNATVPINTPPSVTITGNTATCAGGSVTLDAGAGYATYQWSTTETSRFITVTPSSTTAYNVIVTDANGCSATDSHTVTVNPPPVVNITGPTATCPATPITLDAGPGFSSYSWSTGQTTQTITVTPSTDTTYTVAVTDANNCSATDSHTVTVSASPSTAISAPANVCASSAGHTASVAIQAGATYAWFISGGTITAGQNTDTITFSAGPGGNVILNVTVSTGACTSNGSQTIPINAPPSVAISGPSNACTSTPVTLSVPAIYSSYQWSGGQTTPSITFTQFSTTATYSIVVTDANGCTATASHTVTLNATPDATITEPASVNPGSSGNNASVPSQPGAAYAWSITNGSITAGAGTNSITFSAGSSGTVELDVTVTQNGCSANGHASVPIGSPLPQEADFAITKSAPPAVLAGDSLTYTIVITNNGPLGAFATAIDTLPAGVTLTNVNSGSWSCNPTPAQIPCSGFLGNGVSTTITITVNAPEQAGTITNNVTVETTLTDPAANNNAASATTSVTPRAAVCETVPPSLLSPADNTVVTSPVPFSWSSVNGATLYELWLTNGGSTTLAASTASTSINSSVPSGTSSWFVVARLGTGCDPLVSATRTFTVQESAGCAQHGAPQVTSPVEGSTGGSNVNVSWTAVPQAISYRVWIEVNDTAPQDIGTTNGAISLAANIPPGAIALYVDALFGGCPPTRSNIIHFTVNAPDPCAQRASATLLAPANNTVLGSSQVEFRWTPAPNASASRVWLALDGAPPALLGETTGNSLTAVVTPGQGVWFVEETFDGCASTSSTNFRFTLNEIAGCSVDAPALLAPANGAALSDGEVEFQWAAVSNAIRYEVYDSLVNGPPVLTGATTGTSLTRLVTPGEHEWLVRTFVDRCNPVDSAKSRFTYTPPPSCADHQRPILISPLDQAITTAPVSFDWNDPAGATLFEVYVIRGNNAPALIGSTTNSELANVNLATGAMRWFVRAFYGQECSPLDSEQQQLEVVPLPQACSPLLPPVISAPGEISSGVEFLLQWSSIAGATGYQLQIASNAGFDGADLITTSATSHALTRTNSGNEALAVFARVRAIDSRCTPVPSVSPYGPTAAIFVLPQQGTIGTVPLSDPGNVQYTIVLGPEFAGQSFTAIPTEPWLSVTPASGVVGSGGTNLIVLANTGGLGVGTNSGAIAISLNALSGRVTTHATTTITPTISVNLVTPVKPAPANTPTPDTMIIPAVANAAGINAHFQSDVRVANTSPQLIKYQLTFIPSGDTGISAGRQTTFSIEPGHTVALDDVLKSWFGTGTQNAIGVLQIRPLTTTSSSTSTASFGPLANLVSFASSRTFNVTPNGTFGQYIPAVAYANFAGKSTILSLQQIAQSPIYRTNLGLVEGSGSPADLLIRVFGGNGQQITSFTTHLNGGQHTQLNAFLFERGITLEDGRVEVSVTSSTGKVTAYASVLDNTTADAVLVTPVSLSEAGNTKWVIPGIADIRSGFADWQSDVRIFNADTQPANITASFYSQGGGAPKVETITLGAGEVRQLDKVLPTLFGVTNDGGALHLATTKASRIIATARTYNQTGHGTYGQFISAVTPPEAAAVGTRPLQLLQVEESPRMRSNIGVVEVTGKPVKLEVTITPPDAKFGAVFEVDLAANEFRQFGSLLASLGVGDTYNARVSVRAISGEGRATAYASVIDLATNDPTYVQAQ